MVKTWVDDEYDPYLPSFWDKDLVVIEKNNPVPTLKIYNVNTFVCYLPTQADATHYFTVEAAEV